MRISEYLQQDHQRLDSLLEGFRRSVREGAPDREGGDRLLAGLRRHIFWEEESLFPLVEPVTGSSKVEELYTEHGQLWGDLAELETGLAQGAQPGRLELVLDDMVEILEEHNGDEEETVYVWADVILNGNAAREFRDMLEVTDMPGGWRCLVLRGQGYRGLVLAC